MINEVSIERFNTRPTGHPSSSVGAEGGQACEYISESGFHLTNSSDNFYVHYNRVTHLIQTQVHVYVSEFGTEPHPDISNICRVDGLFLESSNYFFDSDTLQCL